MCLANDNRSNLFCQSTSSLKSASPIEDLSDDVDWRSKMNSVFLGFMEQYYWFMFWTMLIGEADFSDDVDWQSAEEEENF